MFKVGKLGCYCQIFLPILTFLVSLTTKINPAWGEIFSLKQQQLQLTAQVESINNHNSSSLEPEILLEINRARTNPQGYAVWLKEQKQYYDGILLKLPGEKPVRTNKGLQALAEAIDFLEQQKPLPNLTISEKLKTTATSQLEEVAKIQGGENFKNISYGKVTAQAIVMHLIVDDGFPDRRHRTSIFNPDFSLAGITCQEDQIYDNICAIAYEASLADITTKPDVDNGESSSDSDINVATLPQPSQPDSLSEVEVTSDLKVTEDVVASNSLDRNKSDAENNELPEVPEIEVTNLAANSESTTEVEAENQEDNSPKVEVSYIDRERQSSASPAVELQRTDNDKPELTNTPQSDSEILFDNTPLTANLLEKTKRGTLEEGDETIPNDGSFYDSYPLEGNAGDSFIITLESQEFDTFIAIMDSQGNILDQNDDINDNNSNSRLRITLPDDGVYNVIVNAYDKEGKGNYTLTVRR